MDSNWETLVSKRTVLAPWKLHINLHVVSRYEITWHHIYFL